VIFEYDHPNDWHYGGWLGFGPDRMLYLSTGDNIFDPTLQDPASPYGKVLRMRVDPAGTYTVPADNPFGNLTWAMGLRNPWRCGFDRSNGDLWCADVGEDRREEINLIHRGAHYGWDLYEGELPFNTPVTRPYSDFEPAVYAYDHTVGASVIGGYVYRGARHPSLVGHYVYGDLIAGSVWSLTAAAGAQPASASLMDGGVGPVTTFGEDEAGEIYVATATGTILRFDAN
jgi:glucose/arabinose dehydrogenase